MCYFSIVLVSLLIGPYAGFKMSTELHPVRDFLRLFVPKPIHTCYNSHFSPSYINRTAAPLETIPQHNSVSRTLRSNANPPRSCARSPNSIQRASFRETNQFRSSLPLPVEPSAQWAKHGVQERPFYLASRIWNSLSEYIKVRPLITSCDYGA